MTNERRVRTARVMTLILIATLALAGTAVAGEPAGQAWCPTLIAPAVEGDGIRVLTPVRASYGVDLLGNVAVGRLTVRFTNTGETPIDAEWRAARPAGLEIDGLRVIDGGGQSVELKLADAAGASAGKTRTTARGGRASAGRRAAPSAARLSAAGIELAAGESIEIEIGFRTTTTFGDGRFTLSLPPVAGRCAAAAPGGRAEPLIVPAGAVFTIHHPEPLEQVLSETHEILSDFVGDRTEVELTTDDTAGDRRFDLGYALGRADEPAMVGFSGPVVNGETELVIVLAPANDTPPETVRDKEVLFVVDTSGSMRGAKLDQARGAVELCLDQLRVDDRFNVIEFDNNATSVFEQPAAAEAGAVAEAASWLSNQVAHGSTKLLPALATTLQQEQGDRHHRLLIVITDGRLGDEAAVAQFLDQHLGDARFFVVGIGSDAEPETIQRIAQYGRGDAAIAAQPEQLIAAVQALFSGVADPVAWDLSIDWGDAEVVRMQPSRLPDLYAGRAVTLRATVSGPVPPVLRLKASTLDGDREFEVEMPEGGAPVYEQLERRPN